VLNKLLKPERIVLLVTEVTGAADLLSVVDTVVEDLNMVKEIDKIVTSADKRRGIFQKKGSGGKPPGLFLYDPGILKI
jgi:hypothetical protein